MIHPTDVVENQTVRAQRHLPMNSRIPSCRPRNRPVATNKFKERYGSYAARLQQVCFTTIRLLWTAIMMTKRPKFKILNPRQRLLSGQRLKFYLETCIHALSTLSFSATLSTSCMLGLQQQQEKIKIQKFQIRGLLQMGKNTMSTALEKILNCCRVSAFLSRKWERCEGCLYGNQEYDNCRAEKSPWLQIQTRGDFGLSNKGRAANKSLQTAVIASSDVLPFVFHLN
jgi:hypothetical protein